MIIKSIKINRYRNYLSAELIFHPCMNLVMGSNAQGKTNLLEAISYLGLASSFRGAVDAELLLWGEESFFLEGEIENFLGTDIINAAWSPEKKKSWKINNKPRHRLNDIMGQFHTVVFSPEDLYLIKGGPELRRRFLNREMSQLYPDFCELLTRYHKVLRQRNSLLKKEAVSADELAVWTEQLAALGAKIICQRYQFIELLSPAVMQTHSLLSNEREKLSVKYKGFCDDINIDFTDIDTVKGLVLDKLEGLSTAERVRGITLVGPHRDDLLILLNDREAKSFASQGQQRTATLALKLAELKLAERVHGEPPVLILDDVMSELDVKRREQVLSLMCEQAQTFISGTEPSLLESLSKLAPKLSGKQFHVEGGQILREAEF